jgi:ferredoxin
VEACAHGRRAAGAIDLYLSGCEIGIDDALPPFIEEIAPPTAEKVPKVARQAVPSDPPGDRKARMTEFEHSYEEPAALAEARRCMNCGSGAEVLVDKCAACLTCLRVCPFGIPKVTDVARIESTLCQACGICIAECPANAIVSRCRPSTELADRIREALSALPGGVKGVAYVCGHHAAAADWSGQSSRLPGMAEIYLTSTARLSALEILQAFELGAQKVVVVACQEGSDRYPQAVKRTRLRVAQARKLLGEAGLDPQSLQLLEVADEGRQHVLAALAEAQGK